MQSQGREGGSRAWKHQENLLPNRRWGADHGCNDQLFHRPSAWQVHVSHIALNISAQACIPYVLTVPRGLGSHPPAAKPEPNPAAQGR